MEAFQWRAADRTIRSTGRSLIRFGGEIDSFARAHAEKVRNVSDIVNHYANDVTEIAGKVAPDFAAVAIAVDVVSLSIAPIFPPATAVGLKIGAEIGSIPTDVAVLADSVRTESAAVALGADELAEVSPAQRTAQFETDKHLLEGSALSLGFDYVNVGIGQVLPDSGQVSRELISGGALNIVKASSNFEAQNHVIPDVENDVQSKLVPN